MISSFSTVDVRVFSFIASVDYLQNPPHSNSQYCRAGFDSDSLTAVKIVMKDQSLSLDRAIKITPVITYIGVVFSFVGSLSFQCFDYFEPMLSNLVAVVA